MRSWLVMFRLSLMERVDSFSVPPWTEFPVALAAWVSFCGPSVHCCESNRTSREMVAVSKVGDAQDREAILKFRCVSQAGSALRAGSHTFPERM